MLSCMGIDVKEEQRLRRQRFANVVLVLGTLLSEADTHHLARQWWKWRDMACNYRELRKQRMGA